MRKKGKKVLKQTMNQTLKEKLYFLKPVKKLKYRIKKCEKSFFWVYLKYTQKNSTAINIQMRLIVVFHSFPNRVY